MWRSGNLNNNDNKLLLAFSFSLLFNPFPRPNNFQQLFPPLLSNSSGFRKRSDSGCLRPYRHWRNYSPPKLSRLCRRLSAFAVLARLAHKMVDVCPRAISVVHSSLSWAVIRFR